MGVKASVVIAFYNKVRFLELVLAGFSRQTMRDFEIILADDGSTRENVEKADELLHKMPMPSVHLWQEDAGFRKNILYNCAIVKASTDTIIFVDGDCIPHRAFVEEHFKSTKRGFASAGRRVNLSQQLSDKLTAEKVLDGYLERANLRFWWDAICKKSDHSGQGLYFRNRILRKLVNTRDRGILGCNFSVNKNDLLDVNGFDERYIQPSAGEDSDIDHRLRLSGVHVNYLVNIANQYHLYHNPTPRPVENLKMFFEMRAQNISFTPFGIKKNA